MYTVLDIKGNVLYETDTTDFAKLPVEDRRQLAYLAVSEFIAQYVREGGKHWQVLYDSSALE